MLTFLHFIELGFSVFEKGFLQDVRYNLWEIFQTRSRTVLKILHRFRIRGAYHRFRILKE